MDLLLLTISQTVKKKCNKLLEQASNMASQSSAATLIKDSVRPLLQPLTGEASSSSSSSSASKSGKYTTATNAGTTMTTTTTNDSGADTQHVTTHGAAANTTTTTNDVDPSSAWTLLSHADSLTLDDGTVANFKVLFDDVGAAAERVQAEWDAHQCWFLSAARRHWFNRIGDHIVQKNPEADEMGAAAVEAEAAMYHMGRVIAGVKAFRVEHAEKARVVGEVLERGGGLEGGLWLARFEWVMMLKSHAAVADELKFLRRSYEASESGMHREALLRTFVRIVRLCKPREKKTGEDEGEGEEKRSGDEKPEAGCSGHTGYVVDCLSDTF